MKKKSEVHRLCEILERELNEAKARLTEAEWLIRELDGHEGAEGWSEYLRKRLDAYRFSTSAEPK